MSLQEIPETPETPKFESASKELTIPAGETFWNGVDELVNKHGRGLSQPVGLYYVMYHNESDDSGLSDLEKEELFLQYQLDQHNRRACRIISNRLLGRTANGRSPVLITDINLTFEYTVYRRVTGSWRDRNGQWDDGPCGPILHRKADEVEVVEGSGHLNSIEEDPGINIGLDYSDVLAALETGTDILRSLSGQQPDMSYPMPRTLSTS